MANGNVDHPEKKEDSVTIVNTISVIVVIGYIAWMPLWMFFPPSKVPPEVLAILNNMIGAWGYAFAAVIGYHIGNTKTGKDSSAANRETIKSLAATASTAASTAAAIASAPVPAAPALPEKTVDTRTQVVTTEPAPIPPTPPTPPSPPADPDKKAPLPENHDSKTIVQSPPRAEPPATPR